MVRHTTASCSGLRSDSRAPSRLRCARMISLCLSGLRQGRAIISCELFNSPAGQLMLNVKALPWLVETEFLIEDRLAGGGVFEIAVGRRKAVASPIVQHLRRHRHQFGFEQKTVEQLFKISDAGCQNSDMTVAGRIHTLYIRDQIHAVFADVVEAAYERRHIDR